MRKAVHPIRRMSRQVWGKDNWSFLDDDEKRQSDLIVLRHLQPLLDTLSEILVQDGTGCCCPQCKLLAAWKEPLR